MRKAYTLVEALLAVVLASVVFSIFLNSFTVGQKDNSRLTFQLRGLQGAHLLRTCLHQDLASYVPTAQGQKAFSKSRRISFYRVKSLEKCGVYDSCLSKNFKALVERVVYEYDKERRMVFRTCGGKRRPLLGTRFDEVYFSYSPYGQEGSGETIGLHMIAQKHGAEEARYSFYFDCPQTRHSRLYEKWAF